MYRHTQVGTLILGLLIGTGVVVLWQLPRSAAPSAVWLVPLGLLVVGALFGSLTTEVDHERFRFWFGPGLIRRAFPLARISGCRAVTNPWWYGWGIHWTPHGWLYNVAGLQAVEIELQDGRRLRIGTDEPEELCRWIRARKGAKASE